jgi:hypothetical protein
MFKKWFGPKSANSTEAASIAQGMYRPYAEEHVNALYNLLFCDDLSLFKRHTTDAAIHPWNILLADQPDFPLLTQIGEDVSNGGRVRAIAYNRLRAEAQQVPPKQLFGVIVEVALKDGLDVLAAFSDGGARYFNLSGKVAIFEGQGNPIETQAMKLLASCQSVVDKIGAWEKPRLPPPRTGNVRLTFLVSDGLYFGEGPFNVLQQDGMAGPVLSKASNLLQRIVSLAVEHNASSKK